MTKMAWKTLCDEKWRSRMASFLSAAFFLLVLVSGVAIGMLAESYLYTDGDLCPEYITAAIPFFFLLMGIDGSLVSLENRGKKKQISRSYTLSDSLCSITAGLLQQLKSNVEARVVGNLSLFPYLYIYAHFAFTWQLSGWRGCILAFLLIDFLYYVFHRMSHEVNIAWAAHQVHHSSDHYNLTTALRQSAFQENFRPLAYLPLALVLPPPAYLAHSQWNTLYQFWIHTTAVGRLGYLEYVLNTPSHHRVHHDRRVHKNYGGILIIWDRMFGTFLAEGESEQISYIDSAQTILERKGTTIMGSNDDESVNNPGGKNHCNKGIAVGRNHGAGESNTSTAKEIYGILKPLLSYEPIWVQIHMFWALFHRMQNAKSLKGALRLLFVGPGYRPRLLQTNLHLPPAPAKAVLVRVRTKFRSTTGQAYHMIHWICTASLTVAVLVGHANLRAWEYWVCVAASVVSCFTQGTLLEGREESLLWERARLASLGLLMLVNSARCVVKLVFAAPFIQLPYFAPEILENPKRLPFVVALSLSSIYLGSLLAICVFPKILEVKFFRADKQQ